MPYLGKKPVDFTDVTESQTFTVTEDLTVDTDTLHVDSTDGNVGIGTTSPDSTKQLVISNGGAEGLEFSTTDYTSNMRMLAYDRSTSAYINLRSEAAEHEFYIGGTEKWRINSSGNLKAATNGLGIDFSASEGSGASSSVLDDYEEGSWTPQVKFSDTNAATTVTRARYIRIGSMVHISATFKPTATSTGTFEIANLPFTPNAEVETTGSLMTNNVNYETATVNACTYQYNIQSKLNVYASRDDSTWYALTNSHVSSGEQFIISHTYYIS